MHTPPRKVELQLPKSWNSCSLDELRIIAEVMIEFGAKTSRYTAYSIEDVKVALFLALAGIVVLSPPNPAVAIEEQFYIVKVGKHGEPFNLYLWQIHHFVYGAKDGKGKKTTPGLLDWLDDPKDFGLTLFPFPKITKRRRHWWSLKAHRFSAPDALMQDFHWQRFRFAQEYMTYFIDQQNRLVEMIRRQHVIPQTEIVKQSKQVEQAKAMFLATIFTPEVRVLDTTTGYNVKRFEYTSNQAVDYAPYFRGFDDVDWQIVLFWWQANMRYLEKKYPRCYKKQKVKKGPKSNPLEIYVTTTATVEKYLTMTETEVNAEMYQIVLKQIDRMAEEGEEAEKIRHKH